MKNNIELYLGDWKERFKTISDKSIDLIYTDPPYDIGMFKPGSGGSVNNIMNLDKTLLPINQITETKYILTEFCDEAARVMKEINIYIWCNKTQIIHYFNYFVNGLGCKYDILFWNKTNALPTYSNKYLNDCEYLLVFRRGKAALHPECYEDAKTVFQSPINRENKIYKHPNVKPLELVLRGIKNSSREGDLVLDPFMGSGTTGVASKQLGRKFIGCEINPEFFKTAQQRIFGAEYQVKSNKGGLWD